MKFQGRLHQDLMGRRLSRRDMVVALIGMGVAIGPAITLADQFVSAARAQTPKKGGTLKVATADASAGDSMDPLRTESHTTIIQAAIVYEKLTDFDSDGKLVPVLAKSWSPNADASSWTFELREGVTFHNGKSLTSADVVYTLTRAMNDKTSGAAASLSDVASIRADGPSKVVIDLKSSNAEMDYYVATRHLAIVPEGSKDFPHDAIGTGPWKLQEYNPGLTTIFVRNDNYWRGGPFIDSIESTGIGDESARLNALLSGEIDIAEAVNPKAVARLNASGVAKAAVKAGIAHPVYAMSVKSKPFQDNNVRLALKHSFDRQRFLDLAFDGLGEIGRDAGVWPTDPMFCEDVPVPQADPDMVKSLLKKAGQENTTFELHAGDVAAGGANAAVVLAELMSESGANVRAIKEPADSYWSAVYMKVPWFSSMWTGRPTAIGLLEAAYTSSAPYNETGFANAKFDGLILDAKKQLDPAKRKTSLCDAQMILSQEGGAIIPIYVPWIDGISNRVQNFKPHPRAMAGSSLWHDVWLDG